ncbi:hypothetical protein B1R32_10955 [Abditibacterium utsteinense]|uniref:Tetratricopeptide repeat-containing protein n=1 Tax=Abditibacterium utsteinense TaxID=1960156 RepID=A0A2S8SSF9_9BACT|nr:hypothetical protein [Abditibacterium utsteinense]PQV63716.1 hypothetical protein B1R32_10955 [Abditibacterium utsteinense]
MRRFLLLLPLLCAQPALACMNDRDSDSLALQAQKFPDTLRVITGRFERNPPLFYQMRIQRSLAQLKKTPREFGLYDDIAVAYDRLHRDDEALEIMAKKRALLPPFDAKNAKMKEAWYRYYANAGTFRAHRFLGANPQKIKEMQTARDFIKRAIEIKPNAHFGREKYQLMAMEWILAVHERKGKNIFSLGRWIKDRDKWEETWEFGSGPAPKRATATAGLSGLIVLGAAWESADIFEALGEALQSKDGITLRYLTLLRCREILQSGKKPLNMSLNVASVGYELPGDDYAMQTGIAVNKANQKTLDALYLTLRAEAEDWNTKRQSYMLSRLEKGQHPDTDAQFWSEWKPAAPPSLQVDWFNEKQQKKENRERLKSRVSTAFNTLFVTIFAAMCWMMWRVIKSRKRT